METPTVHVLTLNKEDLTKEVSIGEVLSTMQNTFLSAVCFVAHTLGEDEAFIKDIAESFTKTYRETLLTHTSKDLRSIAVTSELRANREDLGEFIELATRLFCTSLESSDFSDFLGRQMVLTKEDDTVDGTVADAVLEVYFDMLTTLLADLQIEDLTEDAPPIFAVLSINEHEFNPTIKGSVSHALLHGIDLEDRSGTSEPLQDSVNHIVKAHADKLGESASPEDVLDAAKDDIGDFLEENHNSDSDGLPEATCKAPSTIQ